MKKILSLALLSMSIAFFGDSADEALFVNHPVFVNPFHQIDDGSVDEETVLEVSESDDDVDELHLQDVVKLNHHSVSAFYNAKSINSVQFELSFFGSIAEEHRPLELSVIAYEGSSRAPPVSIV